MTRRYRRYVAIEAIIGGLISAVLSLAFCLFVFGGARDVPVHGAPGLILDAIPQSGMIALMATLMPTWLTRRRMARGIIPGKTGEPFRLPVDVRLRALLVAAVTALVMTSAQALLLAAAGRPAWPLGSVAIVKTVYGGLLGASIALLATEAALRDRTS